MNLAGVPPLSGFLGKVGLFEAGVEDGRVLALILVIGGALTSLLTLYAIIRVWGQGILAAGAGGQRPGRRCRRTADRIRPFAGRPAAGAARCQRRRVTQEKAAHLPIGMVGATTAVVAVGLLLTVAAGPIYALADKAAASLMRSQRLRRRRPRRRGAGAAGLTADRIGRDSRCGPTDTEPAAPTGAGG